jgi:hypothetical protein
MRRCRQDGGSPHWTHFELLRINPTVLEPTEIVCSLRPLAKTHNVIQAGRIPNRCTFVPKVHAALSQQMLSDTECGIMAMVASGTTLQKMRKNPRGWRIEELQAVAEENSVQWRRPGRGGSHVIFSAAGVREIVSVPAKRPIKPVYIKKFVALIDAAGGITTK